MKQYHLDYENTGYFSKAMIDLLNSSVQIEEFINLFSAPSSYLDKIEQRKLHKTDRELLVNRLKAQNQSVTLRESSQENIELLLRDNTFTICTGHQLSLFTGHLYFIYKLASIVKLSQELKEHYPEYNFVPVFWMASEDHDFEEISSFKYKGRLYTWGKKESGAVGRLNTDGLQEVFDEFSKELPSGKRADYLRELFRKTYLKTGSLSEATRFLVNELFGEYGVVVLDGDDADLKRKLIPELKKELLENTSDKNISSTNLRLEEKSYKIQVTHRAINLFYLKENIRERIVSDGERFKVLNTQISFSKDEIICELEKHPENFSPNSIFRPLYQEKILPNLAYVGGGGELAYWMQLKSNFSEFNVSYPILVLRNSLMYMSSDQYKKLLSLDLTIDELFLKEEALVKVKIDSNIDIDLSREYELIEKLYQGISEKGLKDKSLQTSIDAHLHKNRDLLKRLEKKLIRAERKIHSDKIQKLQGLKRELFPNKGLQERVNNFSDLYMEFGDDVIKEIIGNISVLDNKFTVLIKD